MPRLLTSPPAPLLVAASLADFAGDLDRADEVVLDACRGPVLDAGCGPGRLGAALLARGTVCLGVDLDPEAVRTARRRGLPCVQADVLGPLPAPGAWGTVLLADGNLGLGGDPVALLDRCRRLLAPGGRVLVDLEQLAPGTHPGPAVLAVAHPHGAERRWPWAVVDPAELPRLARPAGLVAGATAALPPVAGRRPRALTILVAA